MTAELLFLESFPEEVHSQYTVQENDKSILEKQLQYSLVFFKQASSSSIFAPVSQPCSFPWALGSFNMEIIHVIKLE